MCTRIFIYIIIIIMLTYCHVMAHGDEEVGLILSSRIERVSSSQKVTVRKECGSRRCSHLSDLGSPDIGRGKREKPNDWRGPQTEVGFPSPQQR